MMTMEDVRSLLTANDNHKKTLEDEIRKLAERMQSVDKEMQSAAEAQNLAKYTALKNEKEMLSDAIRAKREKLISAGRDFSRRDEVLSAWAKYTLKHNAEFEAKKRKYELARKDLCKLFCEIAEMQREALNNQQIVNLAVNADSRAVMFRSMDSDMAKLELMDSKRPLGNGIEQSYPDACLFYASGLLSREALQSAYTVFVGQAPCSTPIK